MGSCLPIPEDTLQCSERLFPASGRNNAKIYSHFGAVICGYFIGEKPAVIYGLCEDCALRTQSKDVLALSSIYERLTGNYRKMYYSLIYGDPDSTEEWGPVSVH